LRPSPEAPGSAFLPQSRDFLSEKWLQNPGKE
jgi:hypothetical protein